MPHSRPIAAENSSSGGDDSPEGTTAETLADLGEWELIRRLAAFAPPGQFNDDAALVPLGSGSDPEAGPTPGCGTGDLVVNTDVLVEGIHFSDSTTAAADVGWRAVAANLSDLAAMGCTQALGLTVGLVAPASTPWSWVEGVYQGLSEALRAHGGVLLGGDCSSGSQRLLAITAIGRLPGAMNHGLTSRQPESRSEPSDGADQPTTAAQDAWVAEITDPRSRPQGRPRGGVRAGDGGAGSGPMLPGAIRRGDGRPGDLLVGTGPHGLSRLGLALLQSERPGPGETARDADQDDGLGRLDPALMQRAIQAHRRPVPRFDAVRALIGCRPEASGWRVGGCDSSDGLGAAVAAIAAASGCAARLEREALPLDPAMAALPQAVGWCLGGGEDFELVLALEPLWAEALVTALPQCSVIGELVAGHPGTLDWADGTPWSAEGVAWSGYRHFN